MLLNFDFLEIENKSIIKHIFYINVERVQNNNLQLFSNFHFFSTLKPPFLIKGGGRNFCKMRNFLSLSLSLSILHPHSFKAYIMGKTEREKVSVALLPDFSNFLCTLL